MATVVLVPMLFSPAGAPSPPTEVSVAAASPDYGLIPDEVGAGAYARPDDFDIAVAALPEPTTTTAPPPTTTTETTVKVSTTTTEPPTTTTAPPPTTTTEVTVAEAPPTTHTHPEPAPTTTTTKPAPPPPADADTRSQEGDASWYELPGARAGVCAHRIIAKGTVVKVTNLDTGKSITCTIDDRGPYADGKIIDLYRDDFARLAPLAQGVFPTRITW